MFSTISYKSWNQDPLLQIKLLTEKRNGCIACFSNIYFSAADSAGAPAEAGGRKKKKKKEKQLLFSTSMARKG